MTTRRSGVHRYTSYVKRCVPILAPPSARPITVVQTLAYIALPTHDNSWSVQAASKLSLMAASTVAHAWE